MRKISLIASALLFITVASVNVSAKQKTDFNLTDSIDIQTTAFVPNSLGTSMEAVTGSISGLEYIPIGDYKVQITNCPSFKGERFAVMTCTIMNFVETIDYLEDDYAVLSTAFIHKGKAHNKLGFYSGCMRALPSNGYKIIVKNGKNKTFWNSMKCKIK